jgi:uncharacterized protein
MVNLRIIQDLILEEQQLELTPGFQRQLDYTLVPGKAFVCLGVRRSGKSTLLQQIMTRLQSENVSREDMLSLNLFDDRLEPIRQGQLSLITDAYYGLYPSKKGRKGLHCFLDEIHLANGWENFVDRLLRSDRMSVYLTGSSARLLQQDMGTAMRGRSLSWELFPFSFAEFLARRGLTRHPRGQSERLHIREAFQAYWVCGGFPETLDVDQYLRTKIHQEYFNTMIFRDVVERNDAIHPRAVRDTAYRLLNATSALYSINAITGYLKPRGHKVSKTFVGDVIAWLEDAFALFSVPIYDASLSRQQANPRKIYAIDHALVRSNSTGILVNRGHLLENLVFVDARRRGHRIYYYRTRNGREVDFVWKSEDEQMLFVQVSEAIPPGSDARAREVKSLVEALNEQPGSRGVIVTMDSEELIETEAGNIEVVPAWRYLLEA